MISCSKSAKQRLTALLFAIVEGENKSSNYRKKESPRCFKDKHRSKLRLEWVQKTWVNTEIITKQLYKYDSKIKNQTEKCYRFQIMPLHIPQSIIIIIIISIAEFSRCVREDHDFIQEDNIPLTQLFHKNIESYILYTKFV